MEQALPLRADWLNFNRFRARAEHTIPMGPYRLLLCGKGASLSLIARQAPRSHHVHPATGSTPGFDTNSCRSNDRVYAGD